MEDKFVKTPSGTFHAQAAGEGEPTILIHGYSPEVNSWRTWEKNIDALSAVVRVFALDLLGYGESDKPDAQPDVLTEAHALVQLLEAEKIARASLVGLSWGGMIAQVVTGTIPDKIHKLVLVDSGYDESEKGRARLHKIVCPTLIVWDEQDAVIPVAGAHFLARNIPNSQLRILKATERDPGANPENRHWSQVTHSIEWNRTVIEFLSE